MSTKDNKDTIKYKNINNNDMIQLNGHIFFIPDKYIEHEYLSQEYKKCYKFILALCINYHIQNNKDKLTKLKFQDYIKITDKVFAYLESGQILGSYDINSKIEIYILSKIPQCIFNKFNPLLTEKNIIN